MSELQHYFQVFSLAHWTDPDPERCLCHGTGWALSEVDTWHRCPIHGKGKPCPEEDEILSAEDASPTERAITIPCPPPDMSDNIPF